MQISGRSLDWIPRDDKTRTTVVDLMSLGQPTCQRGTAMLLCLAGFAKKIISPRCGVLPLQRVEDLQDLAACADDRPKCPRSGNAGHGPLDDTSKKKGKNILQCTRAQ